MSKRQRFRGIESARLRALALCVWSATGPCARSGPHPVVQAPWRFQLGPARTLTPTRDRRRPHTLSYDSEARARAHASAALQKHPFLCHSRSRSYIHLSILTTALLRSMSASLRRALNSSSLTLPARNPVEWAIS